MHIPYNGKDLDLKFDLGALRVIDKEVGIDVEEVQLGQGLEMLVPGLQNGNILTVAAAIKGGLNHQKKRFGAAYIPDSDDAMFEVLDEIAEEHGDLQVFADGIIDELGKRAVTRSMLPEEVKNKYQAEKEQQLAAVPTNEPAPENQTAPNHQPTS